MSRYEVTVSLIVQIDIPDEGVGSDAITRATENHDGFQEAYYGPMDRDDVLFHLAYNASANGVGDASRLDGWADLPEGLVTMDVVHGSGECVDVVEAA